MSDIDDKIRKALEVNHDELKRAIDEPCFFEMLVQCYRGKNRWLSILVIFYIITFVCIGTWSIWQFFHTDSLEAKLGWTLLFIGSLMIVAMGKIWAWMQIHKNIMIREIKRVELQLVRIYEVLKEE